MDWYYALNGQRQGPIAQAEFERLVANETIKADTLVWRQGMGEWLPYAKVAAGGAGGVATATATAGVGDDTAVCAVSGKVYPKREMIQYEGKWIAAEHRDAYFQRMREGVAQPGDSIVPGPFGYGGFWRRFCARFIDGIIQGVVGAILGALIIPLYVAGGSFDPSNTASAIMLQVIVQAVSMAIALAYEVFFVRKFDATPGKMAMGLKILRPDGSKLSVLRIIGRYFATLVSALILLIGYIMAAFDDEKRALHDRMADTRVIKTR